MFKPVTVELLCGLCRQIDSNLQLNYVAFVIYYFVKRTTKLRVDIRNLSYEAFVERTFSSAS
jgi:hypothetical protein